MRRFIAELRRRRVISSAGLYVALGWIGTELVSHLLEIFMADPAPAERIVAIVFVAGFPVWVALTYIFQRGDAGEIAIDPWSPVGEAAIGISLVVLTMLTAALYWLLIEPRAAQHVFQAPSVVYRSIAIAPFTSASGNSEREYLSDSFPDQLFLQLLHAKNLRVVEPDDVKKINNGKSSLEAAEKLGAEVLLLGAIGGEGDVIEVRMRLVDVALGTELLKVIYERKVEDLPGLVPEAARDLTRALNVNLKYPDNDPNHDGSGGSEDAWGLYLRGRVEWRKRSPEGLKAALEYFDRAVKVDPLYAMAHVGIADTYMMLSAYAMVPAVNVFPLVLEEAREALRLDPSLGEAHATLAWAHCGYEWNWAAADAEFREAIRLSPGYASAYHWQGYCLWPQGRLKESEESFRRAFEHDPLSPVIASQRAFPVFIGGRVVEAEKLIQSAMKNYPGMEPPLDIDAHMHMFLGDYPQALASLIQRKNPGLVVMAQAMSGMQEEAEEGLRRLELRARIEFVPAIELVFAYIGMGDTEKALDWLERAHAEHDVQMLWLNTASMFDSLRDEPRFQAVLEQMNFPN